MSTTLYDIRVPRDRPNKALNVWLWIAQALLAVLFFAAGYMHAFMPIEQGTKTPLAAAGLALIMVLAMLVHVARGEANMLGRNIIALLFAAFVAWGRAIHARITPRDRRSWTEDS